MKFQFKSFWVAVSGFLTLCFALSPIASADEARLLSMIQNLEKQMAGMQRTIDRQSGLILDLQKQSSRSFKAMPSESGAKAEAPKWTDGLKFGGDLRLRYEATHTSGPAESDRNRFRFRLRYGFEKKFSDEMKVGFRLASASNTARTSTNTTFDNRFAFKDVSIDRAYVKYTPDWMDGLEIGAGKFGNPLKGSSTWMMWDGDVTPEGAYQKYKFNLIDSDDWKVDAQLLTGQLVLEEGSGTDNDDAELFLYSGTLKHEIHGVTENPLKLKNAVNFYHYNDYANSGNFTPDNGNVLFSSGNFRTYGGSKLASDNFHILEIYNELGFQIPGLPKSKFFFNYANNLGNDAPTKALGKDEDSSYHFGIKLGKAKKKGTWQAAYEYAWIEANSIAGEFADGDFFGANQRGSKLSFKYAFTDYLQLSLAAYFTNNITSGNVNVGDDERRLIQTDLVWKF